MQMTGIIIINYQTWSLSLRCMKSIQQTCAGYPYKIYLVDSASTQPIPERERCVFSDWERAGLLRMLQMESNRGYAAGCNTGIAAALADGCGIFVFANSDIVFQKGAILAFADCLRRYPQVGIVGPKVIDGRGAVQPSRCSMKTGIREIFELYTVAKKLFFRKRRAYYCLDQDARRASYVYHVSGCCFAMRKDCVLEITPLDEGTVLYDEELILGICMEQAGYRTRYEPKSVVVHRHGASTNRVRPFMYQCISQSELYYCAKYLHAKKWQLWLLYQYRRFLYLIRSIADQDLRKHWILFAKETKKTYQGLTEKKKDRSRKEKG
ncbi:MAG: glycosyltransferase family 2 protein [Eubacterium sp.]|nr:glycosyltransferase family 2 protein [Eubacterium sp.]